MWKRARGVRPSAAAFSSVMISAAEAPSQICDEFAGSDLAVGLERRLQAGEALGRRAGADALVTGVLLAEFVDLAAVAVEDLGVHGDDLVVEAALVRGLLAALLGLGAERVEVFAGDAPLVGDHVGADALGHEAADRCVASHDGRAERDRAGRDRGAHRRGRHDLDAGGDRDVVRAGDDALGGEVGGLLARTALAVDGGGGHRLGPTGAEHGVAADVEALATDLHDATHDHVVDQRGVEVVALGERLEHFGGEVGGVPPGQTSISLAASGADGVDDNGVGH